MSNYQLSADIQLWKNNLVVGQELLNSVEFFLVIDKDNFLMTTLKKKTFAYGDCISKVIFSFVDSKLNEITALRGKNIKQAIYVPGICGYLIILTEDGWVYLARKGYLQLKSDELQIYKQIFDTTLITSDNKWMIINNYRKRIEITDTGRKEDILKICDSSDLKLVLTKDREIFIFNWNYGWNSTLKKANNISEFLSERKILIKDIVRLNGKIFLLLEDGTIYSSEYSYKLKDFELNRVKLPIENVKSIVSNNRMAIALTKDNSFYAWGQGNGLHPYLPTKTYRPVKSFSEASSLFGDPLTFGWTKNSSAKITIFPSCELDYTQNLSKIFLESFDNPNEHDVVFLFKDGRKIYAKKGYLSMVSKYLDALLRNQWDGKNCVKIEKYSYDAYYAYLSLLHFKPININEDNLFELIDLAKCSMEQIFLNNCEQFMFDHINLNNLKQYYELATKYDLKNIIEKIRTMVKLEFPTQIQTHGQTNPLDNDDFLKKCIDFLNN